MFDRSPEVGAARAKTLLKATIVAFMLLSGIAIGAFLPGGVAAASSVFGQSTQVGPQSGVSYVGLYSVSCSSSGNCTGVGMYETGSTEYPLAVTETGGVWGAAQALQLPNNAYTPYGATMTGVSCTAPGDCVSVGSDYTIPYGSRPVEATETNGVWSQMVQLTFPAGADNTYEGVDTAVSCPSLGNCVATGYYPTGGTDIGASVDVETNGTWAQAVAIDPPSNESGWYSESGGISCATDTADCTLVGEYDTGSTGAAMAVTETNGSWAQGVEISDGSSPLNLSGVSCETAGNCQVIGSLPTGMMSSTPIAITQTNGSWSQATDLPLPSDASTSQQFGGVSGLSCTSSGDCVAVGTYTNTANDELPLVYDYEGGTWVVGPTIEAPSNQSVNGYAGVTTVSCVADGSCELGGYYEAGSLSTAFVTSGTISPVAPAGVVATPGNGSAQVSWTLSPNATSYSVYSSTTAGAEDYAGTPVCTVTSPDDECTVTGLTNGTNYYFTVVASDSGADSSPSNEAQAEPQNTSASYYVVGSDGGAFSFGEAPYYGSMANKHLSAPVVGVAATPDNGGYWEVASDGGIFTFGNAQYYGSMAGKSLSAPIVGIASTPDGGGYWEVASDGGVFAFGDAKYYGSEGGKDLGAAIVGIARTASGNGYWEVAADGAVYSFGDATYYGGESGKPLNAPIVGMAAMPDGDGYWLVGSDGGVFCFGAAQYYGSEAGKHLNKPMVGITPTPTGDGYWEVAGDGGVFSFGDAGFVGSMGGGTIASPAVGIVSPSQSA